MYSIEEFDKQKTKVLKYIMYKKRTESEVRTKFKNDIEENLLEDIIEYLKEANYINDKEYIKKIMYEFMNLKTMSVKEIIYKLYNKGLPRNIVEDYVRENIDELEDFERKSADKIINKKIHNTDPETIKNYLLRKGYKIENIKIEE